MQRLPTELKQAILFATAENGDLKGLLGLAASNFAYHELYRRNERALLGEVLWTISAPVRTVLLTLASCPPSTAGKEARYDFLRTPPEEMIERNAYPLRPEISPTVEKRALRLFRVLQAVKLRLSTAEFMFNVQYVNFPNDLFIAIPTALYLLRLHLSTPPPSFYTPPSSPSRASSRTTSPSRRYCTDSEASYDLEERYKAYMHGLLVGSQMAGEALTWIGKLEGVLQEKWGGGWVPGQTVWEWGCRGGRGIGEWVEAEMERKY